jgi:predicted Ser/Thr protein kinase
MASHRKKRSKSRPIRKRSKSHPAKRSKSSRKIKSKKRSKSRSKSHSTKKRSKSSHKIKPKSKVKSKPVISHKYKSKYGNKLIRFIPQGYHLIKKLGDGVAGVVYLLCRHESDCKVLKIVKLKNPVIREQFERELIMQKKFEASGLGPKIYRVGKFKKGKTEYGVIEMERVSGTFDDILKTRQPKHVLDWIVDSVDKITKELCKHGLIHGDAHFGNFAYQNQPNGKRKPMLIDFGLSCCKGKVKCDPRLEYITIIRGLPFMEDSGIEEHNLEYLLRLFVDIYHKRYNPHLHIDEDSVEDEFDDAQRRYLPLLDSRLASHR